MTVPLIDIGFCWEKALAAAISSRPKVSNFRDAKLFIKLLGKASAVA